MHIGLICPELSGHLNPMTTLGQTLQLRGHRVSVLARLDAEKKVRDRGLEFIPLGTLEFPRGSISEQTRRLGEMQAFQALTYTVKVLKMGTEVVLRDGLEAARSHQIEGLVIDQLVPAGSAVAERSELPYVYACNALAMNIDPACPPAMLPWKYRPGMAGRVRNALGNELLRWVAKPVARVITEYRKSHGLPPRAGLGAGTLLAEITQQPAFLDFPRKALPDYFHYTGPWHHVGLPDSDSFPWHELDGRPLIYASLGTLQNRVIDMFGKIASAVDGMNAQLVIALGNADQNAAEIASGFAGKPIVVPYAPQLKLLQRATLAITHAGLNTALESLTQGVPMVAIPITNDQPGVARRLEWLGVAEVVLPARLTVDRLRAAIHRVLTHPEYRRKALECQKQISAFDGCARAADIIDQAMFTRERVKISY